jgi:ribonuclease HII
MMDCPDLLQAREGIFVSESPDIRQGELLPEIAFDLYRIERELLDSGMEVIVGIDEAGRGPLAGPVVAGAVYLGRNFSRDGLNDSKLLSETQRQRQFLRIVAEAEGCAVGICGPREIEELNILGASLEAMKRAVDHLRIDPDMLLVDGNKRIPTILPQRTIVKGDRKSASIAAASIVAKVMRDRLMSACHESWPEYDWRTNKGYPTLFHRTVLKKLGPCVFHRRNFSPVSEPIAAEIGKKAEDAAAVFLKKNGYRILDRNLQMKSGEIDILARQGKLLVIVEVKGRQSSHPGNQPEFRVDGRKRKRLRGAGQEILAKHRMRNTDIRYDIVTVDLSKSPPKVEVMENAF